MRKFLLQKHICLSIDMVVSKTDWTTNHPNLENEALKLKREAPKTRKRSTQNSKPVCPLKTRDSPLSSHQG